MNKNIAYVILALIVLGVIGWFVWGRSSGDSNEKSSSETTQTEATSEQPKDTPPAPSENNVASGNCTRTFNNSTLNKVTVNSTDKFVTMTVKGFGDIKIELNRTSAPKTSENFLKLAASGFYDCLTFHRVAKDFVVQGGDPDGNGSGGPGYTVPAEIGLPHKKGAIAMARLGDQANPAKSSSGSQFYFALNDLPMLDGEYTVFGQVVSGMDVVEKIGGVPIVGVGDGAPVEKVEITKAVVSAN